MTDIRTKWASAVESMEHLGLINPRIQTRITETLNGKEVSHVLMYDALGHEMVVDYGDNREQIRIDMVTRYNVNPGSPEYYMRRLFPFDLLLNQATGQEIFIYCGYRTPTGGSSFEGFRAQLLGFTDEGVVLGSLNEETKIVRFEDAMGAIVVHGQDRDKLDWILEYPVNDYPLVTKPLESQ